jgi:hypothetical protein
MIVACRKASAPDAGISVAAHLDPQPARVGSEIITVTVADVSSRSISHARVTVEADMSHPGMSPVFGEATETAPGTYVGKIDFSMGGDWILLMHVKLPGGQKIERQIAVPGVRSN